MRSELIVPTSRRSALSVCCCFAYQRSTLSSSSLIISLTSKRSRARNLSASIFDRSRIPLMREEMLAGRLNFLKVRNRLLVRVNVFGVLLKELAVQDDAFSGVRSSWLLWRKVALALVAFRRAARNTSWSTSVASCRLFCRCVSCATSNRVCNRQRRLAAATLGMSRM